MRSCVTPGLNGDMIWAVREQETARRRFEAVFAAHSQLVFDYALRRTWSRADAADVMAETMLVAWRRIDDVPQDDAARLWLYGVARRILSNHRRSLRRRHQLGQKLREHVTRIPSPPHNERDDDDGRLLVAMRLLTPDEQELLRLTSWEGLDGNEIAVVLGISPGAVRVRLHRARGRLRATLDAVADPLTKECP